jgi:poly(glycerol-phosphate) alpha-glucosyltransferase
MGAVLNLSKALSTERGVEVEVMSVQDEASNDDLPLWEPLPVHLFSALHAGFRYAPALAKHLASAGADLTHVHGLWTYLSIANSHWAKAGAGEARRPYLISPQGMLDPWALQNSRWKKWIAASVFERRHLRDASCIHAVGESELSSIRAFGLKNPVCVIPNGARAIDEFVPALPPPWNDEIVRGRKVLLYLGRIHLKKGLTNLLRGWQRSLKDNSRWILIVAGWDQDDHRRELEELARRLGILDSVHFAGPLFGKSRDAAYQHAKAFVLPSLSEGQPLAVLEAWSHGLPVLMTPECNLTEGFDEGAAIRIAPTVDGAADGLNLMASSDEAELAHMGQRGKALVAIRFSWPRIAEQMVEVYRWLLGEADRPGCVVLS